MSTTTVQSIPLHVTGNTQLQNTCTVTFSDFVAGTNVEISFTLDAPSADSLSCGALSDPGTEVVLNAAGSVCLLTRPAIVSLNMTNESTW